MSDPPTADPRTPVPDAMDDARLRREEKAKEEAARARDGVKPSQSTYDPMPPPLGSMS